MTLIMNHIMYADDLVVISPSNAGLQQLLNICSAYGVEHDITYNASKSAILICRVKEDKCINFTVFKLAGKTLEYCKKVRYLGHFIREEMTDDADTDRECRRMYAQGKTLARKFGVCTENVKVCLFKAICTPLYTAHLWSQYKKSSIQKLQVAYNDAMRLLFKQRRWCSASQMLASAGVSIFYAVVQNLMYKFMGRLEKSGNSIIVALCNSMRSCSRYSSRLRAHWLKSLFVNCF